VVPLKHGKIFPRGFTGSSGAERLKRLKKSASSPQARKSLFSELRVHGRTSAHQWPTFPVEGMDKYDSDFEMDTHRDTDIEDGFDEIDYD